MTSLISKFAKPIKSVLITVLAVTMFTGFVLCAYSIEGSMNVGFKPDFQNQNTSYSTNNTLFADYGDAISIKVTVHGTKEFTVQTTAETVGEVIEDLSITVGSDDSINYPLDDNVIPGMEIKVDHLETVIYTETATVPFETTVNESQTIPKGTTKVIQKGVDGSATQTVEELYVNGELQERKITESIVITEPVNEIVAQGIGGSFTDEYGNTYAYSYYIDVTATAYGSGSGVTASGKAIDYGMIAVDTSVIPLGTKVFLDCDSWSYLGVYTAEDTGSAIVGKKIDVFLGDDYSYLMQFGVRSLRMYILE